MATMKRTTVSTKELKALREVRDIMTEVINKEEVLFLTSDETVDRLVTLLRATDPN